MTATRTQETLEAEVVTDTAVARVDDAPQRMMSVQLMPVPQMQAVTAEYTLRRTTFRRWLLSQMVEGVHFGFAPGCEPRDGVNPEQWTQKPGLYKAGAQLLCDLMRMQARWESDEIAWKQLGSLSGTFVIRCQLFNIGSPFFADRAAGDLLGEGRGVFAVNEKKMNANAAIKMAEKRAMVDAVINTLAIADLFTQDRDPEDAPPSPKPDRAADAPQAPTRQERKADPRDRMKAIGEAWAKKYNSPDRQAFIQWCREKLSLRADQKLAVDVRECDILEPLVGIGIGGVA